MSLTSTRHEGDRVRFEFDGVIQEKNLFVEWEHEGAEALHISRIEPVPTALTVPNAAEARVALRTEQEEIVSGGFGVASDDALICKKPVVFRAHSTDGTKPKVRIRAEVSGPVGQRVRFALTGKLIPPDDL